MAQGDTPGSMSTGSIHTGFILPPLNRTSDISKCGTDVSTLVMALQGENFASRLSRLRPRTCSSQGIREHLRASASQMRPLPHTQQ